MCTVASAPGLLGRPASESGRLCHRDHERSGRCRRVLMLPILSARKPANRGLSGKFRLSRLVMDCVEAGVRDSA